MWCSTRLLNSIGLNNITLVMETIQTKLKTPQKILPTQLLTSLKAYFNCSKKKEAYFNRLIFTYNLLYSDPS